jgi:hypothetical protein
MPTDDKISALPSGTIDSLRVLFPISIGIPSSPQTIRSELAEVSTFLGINNGWYPVFDTWSRNASNAINVPSGATLKYQKGWGIRFKQGGGFKYMYIIVVADTLLTVTGGSDYSVSSDPITDVSFAINPGNAFGFPDFFNHTPTYAGFSSNPTDVARFSVKGRLCSLSNYPSSLGTSNAGGYTMTLPINAVRVAYSTLGIAVDNGSFSGAVGQVEIDGTLDKLNLYKSGRAAWTSSGSKGAYFNMWYEI